jgi:hypothetical protein
MSRGNPTESLARTPSVWFAGGSHVRGDTSQVWGWIGLIRGVEGSRVAAGRVARFGLSFAAAWTTVGATSIAITSNPT